MLSNQISFKQFKQQVYFLIKQPKKQLIRIRTKNNKNKKILEFFNRNKKKLLKQ